MMSMGDAAFSFSSCVGPKMHVFICCPFFPPLPSDKRYLDGKGRNLGAAAEPQGTKEVRASR